MVPSNSFVTVADNCRVSRKCINIQGTNLWSLRQVSSYSEPDEADTTEDVVEGTQIPNDAPQRSARFCTEQGDEEINITSEVLLDVLSETPRPRNLSDYAAVDPAHNDEMAGRGLDWNIV